MSLLNFSLTDDHFTVRLNVSKHRIGEKLHAEEGKNYDVEEEKKHENRYISNTRLDIGQDFSEVVPDACQPDNTHEP